MDAVGVVVGVFAVVAVVVVVVVVVEQLHPALSLMLLSPFLLLMFLVVALLY